MSDIKTTLSDEQFEKLLYTIRDISHGGQSGPMGLESVAMALGGEGSPGKDNSVAHALRNVADSLEEIATAIENAGCRIEDALQRSSGDD